MPYYGDWHLAGLSWRSHLLQIVFCSCSACSRVAIEFLGALVYLHVMGGWTDHTDVYSRTPVQSTMRSVNEFNRQQWKRMAEGAFELEWLYTVLRGDTLCASYPFPNPVLCEGKRWRSLPVMTPRAFFPFLETFAVVSVMPGVMRTARWSYTNQVVCVGGTWWMLPTWKWIFLKSN